MIRQLLAAATLVLLPAAAGAQNTAPVQLTVLGEVQLTRVGVTDFGPVGTAGGTFTIDPAAPTGAQQTASFTASGPAGATIIVSWAPTLDLCHETAGCVTKLVFTPNVSALDFFSQGSSTSITSGTSRVLSGGQHHFWLGGSVPVPASPTPGLYSGTFTLSAIFP